MLKLSSHRLIPVRDARISPFATLAANRLMSDDLPPAARLRGVGQEAHLFIWLARLMAWQALTPKDAPPTHPGRLVAELSQRLESRFEGDPRQEFPVLCQPPPEGSGPVSSFLAAADALAGLGNVPLQADLVGPLYELATPAGNTGAIGQYLTPHSVVELLLARAMKWRRPRILWDPAFGTGAFLVPATARLREGISGSPARVLEAVLSAVRGAEVSPVAHAIGQANLLLAVADLLPHVQGRMQPPQLMRMDSLGLLRGEGDGEAALVLGNPPYLGERRHKGLFDDAVDRHPVLRRFRWARMDLFYWFIVLGLDLLRPGGRLAFITTSYWLTADGAEELRAHVAHRAFLREIIDFGNQRVFHTAGGQHSMIFILEKRSAPGCGSNGPVLHAQLKRPGPLPDRCVQLRQGLELVESDGSPYEDADIRVNWSSSLLDEDAKGPWHFCGNRRSAEALDVLTRCAAPLEQFLEVHQGLVSGADRVVRPHLPLLAPEITEGEGIFVLDEQEVARCSIPSDCPVLKPFYKNSDIDAHHIQQRKPQLYVLYLDGSCDVSEFPAVRRHLERFRPVLEGRRECLSGHMQWWRLHWPRDSRIFTGEKIVCPHRAEHNRFAYHGGEFFASADVYFLIAPWRSTAELLFFAGLLNSTVLNVWFRERGKRKGRLREYYSTPLRRIPLVPPPAVLACARTPVVWMSDAALQDVNHVVDRTRWARAKGDCAAAALVLVQAVRRLIELRGMPTQTPYQILAAVLQEQRLEELIDELTMDLYGLTGSREWVREWLAEESAVEA